MGFALASFWWAVFFPVVTLGTLMFAVASLLAALAALTARSRHICGIIRFTESSGSRHADEKLRFLVCLVDEVAEVWRFHL